MAKKKKEKEAKKKQTTKGLTGLAIAKKAIEKKYGKVISNLGAHEDFEIPTISTGSLGVDLALGRGGMGRGRVYEIYGNPSGGKTTLALSVLIQAQLRGLRSIIVDAEHAIDPKLVKNMGADIDNIEIVQAFSGEQNLDIAEQYIKSGEVDLVIIDSVSSLIPESEADANISDDFIALLARLMSKALRRIVPIANETNTLVIFINQIRHKVGSYGNPESPTGGEALPFFATGRLCVKGAEYKSNRIEDEFNGTDEFIGHWSKIEVVKNKLAPPFRKAQIPLIYGEGFDTRWEVLPLAESLGLIDRTGAWYKYKDKSVAQGKVSMVRLLREDDDLFNELRDQVIERTGLKALYESNK